MKNINGLKKINNIKLREKFEKNCNRLIISAYQTSLTEKVIQLDWMENDISHELYEIIDENPKRIQWKISLNREFILSKPVNKKKGFANKLPKIDLRMSCFGKELEYRYFFEAKNLKENDSALKRRYIDTGIDNFVSGKYSNGSLLGYLLDGKTDETIKGINSLLEKDNRKAEFLQMKDFKIHKDYYESNHPNIGTLKHLIFDFTSN